MERYFLPDLLQRYVLHLICKITFFKIKKETWKKHLKKEKQNDIISFAALVMSGLQLKKCKINSNFVLTLNKLHDIIYKLREKQSNTHEPWQINSNATLKIL